MSTLCDLALAFGLSLGGTCQPGTPAPDPMPADEPAAWSYKEPVPVPKKEEAKPQPAFPPIVIKKEVIREVQVPAPAPAPVPKPVVQPVAQPKQPSAVELALRAAYRDRAAGLTAWPEIVVPASLTEVAGKAKARASIPRFAPSPLDLAAVVRKEGEQEYEAEKRVSSLPIDNSRIVAADRVIAGTLENGINTQLDGTTGASLVIQVSRDVYGYHGRNVLIPKGSRLLCEYQSPEKIGESRAAVRCGRILLGESRAEIFNIKANVTDAQGYLGVTGEVDTRFTERFGTAIVLAGISAAVRAATATSSNFESMADYSDSLTTGGEELSKNLGNVAASALEQTVNLAPILKVAQGTRVQIRPSLDWYIAKVE